MGHHGVVISKPEGMMLLRVQFSHDPPLMISIDIYLEFKQGLIVRSGFEKFSPDAILETNITKYNINDCYLQGTEFQNEVWRAIAKIPYGQTVSYGELVKMVGRGSPQAAGTACGKNKIPVIIPCHRVVGKTNPLAFNAGADIKRQLLLEEGITLP